MVETLTAVQETWVQSLGWEYPLEEGVAAHRSILAGEPTDRGAWWAVQSMGSQRAGQDWAAFTFKYH